MEDHRVPEDELIQTRLDKLARMREIGKEPFAIERYPLKACVISSDGSTRELEPSAQSVMAEFEKLDNEIADGGARIEAVLAGRVVSLRLMGKAAFAHIQDRTGRLQLYLKGDDLGDDYELVKLLDLGDIVGAEGFVFRTRTGEVSLHCGKIDVLAKSVRPIPLGKEKEDHHWYGLQDVEQRYRHRHLDLIANAQSRKMFELRSRIIRAIREFYDGMGYLEVETPVLQLIAGGAAARPFNTYHNALAHEFHLRISLELYLKRLIVGGMEKVYEIGRVFRNEGLSTRHNPEFTLLESYEAYADLDDVMTLVEELMRHVCRSVYGAEQFQYAGQTIDLAKPFGRLPILEGIRQYAGIEPEAFHGFETALEAMRNVGLSTEGEHMVGGIIEKVHERFTQPNLVQPTFITDFPIETSPLAKKRSDNPNLVRRFEVYVAKQETGNAFSEINDPADQRERFDYQSKMRAGGDEEAHPMDEEFLKALEYGMPPTGGLGIGVDRLVMILTDQDNIRDVILFPQMKPE